MLYQKHIDNIITLIFNNKDFSYNRIVFNKKGRKIGEDIYKIGGYKGLFVVMDLLVKHLQDLNYSNIYLNDLRELECSWSGICEEFQA